MIRRMGADRQRKPMAIHNGHDFHTLTALCRTNLVTAALGQCKRGVDKAFRFIKRTFIPKCVGKIHQNIPQHFAAASLLETATNRFVVRIALRQHVPLRDRNFLPFKRCPGRDDRSRGSGIGPASQAPEVDGAGRVRWVVGSTASNVAKSGGSRRHR